MIIKHPVLPPKTGYVEVLNRLGEHVYQATPEQLGKEAMQLEQAQQTALLQILVSGATEEAGT